MSPAHEVVTMYQELARRSPGGYLDYLARSLANLAAHLSMVGRHEEALDPSRQAVAIHRRLAGVSPGCSSRKPCRLTQRPGNTSDSGRAASGKPRSGGRSCGHLSGTGGSLPQRLPAQARAVAGHPGEMPGGGRPGRQGPDPARQAVAIYRKLAEASPAAYEDDLVRSLDNLATRLSRAGLRDEALQVATEALTVSQQLGKASTTDLERLASSKATLAVRLAEMDRTGEALEAAQDAVAIYRELADTSPGTYQGRLAQRAGRPGLDSGDSRAPRRSP